MSVGAPCWGLLADELDAWAASARRATLWWRDDDACSDGPALRRLLGIAQEHAVPVAIAAIPEAADSTLAGAIARFAQATIVQHGYAHRNHAPAGERSAEFGVHRSLDARLADIRLGHDRLARIFGGRFHAVFVPPWNRIGADIVVQLPAAGLPGLSRFGPRGAATAFVVEVNTHVDLIAWKRGRVFIGEDKAIERLVAELRARRLGEADAGEPTGILTHHLAFDAAAFGFVDELLRRTARHRAVAWIDVGRAFAPVPAPSRATCVRSA